MRTWLAVVAVALFGFDADPCEEHVRRWGTRSPGCPKETAGDRWSRDQEAKSVLDSPALAEAWRAVEIQDAGDALLWIDQEGNVGASMKVEQIVYFDRTGKPIGTPISERCRRSVESARGASAILCFADDSLSKVLP